MPRKRQSKGRRVEPTTAEKSRKSRPVQAPPTPAPAVSEVAKDALARYELKLKQDEATLRADPGFVEGVRTGERWKAAQEAVGKAVAPFTAEIENFTQLHGRDYPPDSDLARRFEALVWARSEAALRAYSENGFPPAKLPTTPRELRRELDGYNAASVESLVESAGFKRPDDVFERESDDCWRRAETMVSAHPALPQLGNKPARGVDRLAVLRGWCDRCDVAEAYAAASAFVHELGTLAFHARAHRSRDVPESVWKPLGSTYAAAFIAWHDLGPLVTSAVRESARATRGVDAPVIRLGRSRATATVLEAVADELGTAFRNALYSGRRHPLEPDAGKIVAVAMSEKPFGYGDLSNELLKKETSAVIRARLGIQTWEGALLLMVAEWEKQSPDSVWAVLAVLEFRGIDFDELEIRLKREATAATVPAKTVQRSASQSVTGDSEADIGSRRLSREPVDEWRTASWIVSACHEFHPGDVTIDARTLWRARGQLSFRMCKGNQRLIEYAIAPLLAHSKFSLYKSAINNAISSGWTGIRRTRSRAPSKAHG